MKILLILFSRSSAADQHVSAAALKRLYTQKEFHPLRRFLPKILASGSFPDREIIVFEYVGDTLDKLKITYLKKHRVKRQMLELLKALKASRVVHGDIK